MGNIGHCGMYDCIVLVQEKHCDFFLPSTYNRCTGVCNEMRSKIDGFEGLERLFGTEVKVLGLIWMSDSNSEHKYHDRTVYNIEIHIETIRCSILR